MSLTTHIQSHQSINALAGSLLVLGLLATYLRYHARCVQKTYLGADDYLMFLGMLAFIGMATSVFYGTTHRVVGYPHGAPGATSTENYIKAVLAFDMTTEACMGFVKLSALFFFRRVFCVRGQWEWFRITSTICIVLVSLWTIAYFVLPPLECGPHLSSLWTAFDAKQFCKVGAYWLVSQSSIDLVFEIIILLLPVPKIWSLHTTVKRRLAITFVFLTALISLGASIARLILFVLIRRMEASGRVTDGNLSNTELQWLIVLESGMALIAVNLPTLYFLRKRVSPEKVLGSIRSALSLSSIRSSGNRSERRSVWTGIGEGVRANESGYTDKRIEGEGGKAAVMLGLVPDAGTRYENFACHDDETKMDGAPTDHGITVSKNISQVASHV